MPFMGVLHVVYPYKRSLQKPGKAWKAFFVLQETNSLQIVAHFASLKDSLGKDLLSVCTYDTRGIGGSTVPQKLGQYSTRLMAEDALALMDYLEWEQAHILGLSLGGDVFIGCRFESCDYPGPLLYSSCRMALIICLLLKHS